MVRTKKTRPSKTKTRREKRTYTEEEKGQMVEGLINMLGKVKLETVLFWIEKLKLKEQVTQNPDKTIGDMGKEFGDAMVEWERKDPEEFKAVVDYLSGRSNFLVTKKRL